MRWTSSIWDDAQRNDDKAWQELRAQAVRIALRIVGSVDAEDAAQYFFAQFSRDDLILCATRESPLTFFNACVRNACINWLRRADNNRPITHLDPSRLENLADTPPVRPDHAFEAFELAGRLAGCRERLKGQPRRVFDLYFYAGCDHDEIATRLAISPGNVSSLLRLARLNLKACLERRAA